MRAALGLGGLAVAVAGVGPAELAYEVDQRDRSLGARLEVPELDVAVGQFVAEDDREVRPVT